jgi:hypothetical protein
MLARLVAFGPRTRPGLLKPGQPMTRTAVGSRGTGYPWPTQATTGILQPRPTQAQPMIRPRKTQSSPSPGIGQPKQPKASPAPWQPRTAQDRASPGPGHPTPSTAQAITVSGKQRPRAGWFTLVCDAGLGTFVFGRQAQLAWDAGLG